MGRFDDEPLSPELEALRSQATTTRSTALSTIQLIRAVIRIERGAADTIRRELLLQQEADIAALRNENLFLRQRIRRMKRRIRKDA